MNFFQKNYPSYFSFAKGNNTIYLLLLITFGLRVHNFSSASIWVDESITLDIIHRSVSEIYMLSLKDVNAPFYTLITHFWALLFGYSLPAVRFFSVICSTLTAAVIFKMADKNFGRSGALLSTLLFSFSNIHIYYSQEARCYALLCLLASLSLFYFLEIIKSMNKKDLILYSLFSLLTIYTQLFFGLQLLLQGIFILICYRSDTRVLKHFILSQVAIVLLFAAWFVPTFLFKGHVDLSASWVPPITSQSMMRYFGDLFNTGPMFYSFMVFYIGGFIFAFIKTKQKKDNAFLFWFLLSVSVLPFLTMCLVSYFFIPLFYPRFVLFSSIPLFISFGYGLSQMPEKWYTKAIVAVLLVFMSIDVTLTAFRNQDWDKACALEAPFRTDSTYVIISPYYAEYCYIYYNMRWAYNEEFKSLYYYKDSYHVNNLDDSTTLVNRKLDKYKRIIYFDSNPEMDNRLPIYFKHHYDSVYAKHFYGLDFYVFDRKEEPDTLKK